MSSSVLSGNYTIPMIMASDRQLQPMNSYSSLIVTVSLVVMDIQCVSKNIPDIFSYNSRKHCRILIIFGTCITEKVSNQ